MLDDKNYRLQLFTQVIELYRLINLHITITKLNTDLPPPPPPPPSPPPPPPPPSLASSLRPRPCIQWQASYSIRAVLVRVRVRVGG